MSGEPRSQGYDPDAVSQLAFVMSPRQGWPLREVAATLRYELDQQDMPSTVHMDLFPEPGPGTVYVLVGPREYAALEGDASMPDDQILKRTIFLSAEEPGSLLDDPSIDVYRRAGAVFDIHWQTVARLRQAGIPARHLRPGYSKLRDRFDLAAERPIDVLFYGSHSLRRTRQLASCAGLLAGHNCVLQISDDSNPNTGDSTSFLGENRWGLLEQAKIALNVHRGEAHQLEWLRLLDAIHTGAVVVTEHSSGLAPLVPGEHLLVAAPESLRFVLEAAIDDEQRLVRLRTQAYELLRTWLPFALSASVFRAAALELVGPTSTNAYLGRRQAGYSESDSTPNGSTDRLQTTIRRGIEEVSLEVIELRRDVARLEQLVRSEVSTSSATRVLHESPAWSGRRRPEVSVLIGIHNHAPMLCPTLDSLARSSSRALELVVVDDGSTDDSRDVAIDWMHVHTEMPSLLVSHPFERGMGNARNTALGFARAPNCLILNAVMEVYPRCLDVLAWTLAGIEDIAFAYPILEVIGMADEFVAAGGDYLMNVFGWEAERLGARTRIDTLTMIRTECLRELDGFTTDPLMAGYEDHDLWCRTDGRGWRGQLVPQILGRYRAIPATVGRSANLWRVPERSSAADGEFPRVTRVSVRD